MSIAGHKVYGVRITAASASSTQVGYRNNHTTGVATGDQPESIYEVTVQANIVAAGYGK